MMRDYDEILADLDMWASIQPEAAEAIRALLDRVDELESMAPTERAVPVEMNLGDILAAREPDAASDEYCRGLTDGWNAYRNTLLAPGAGGGE